MQFATFTTLLLTLGAGSVWAESCYQTGADFSPWTDRAKWHAERACNGYYHDGKWINGKLTGYYDKNQKKQACVDLAPGKSMVIDLQNFANGRLAPRKETCYDIYTQLILECYKGGSRKIADWDYR
jgi:hypothetical protein